MSLSYSDWSSSPFEVIRQLFEENYENAESFHERVSTAFRRAFDHEEKLLEIPSLNDIPTHNLKPNSLVRFRCMIQDMFDPEFYLDAYETIDKTNAEQRRVISGFAKDTFHCKSTEELDMTSPRNVTADRLPYYCISVPLETKWVRNAYTSKSRYHTLPNISITDVERSKRSHEDDNNETSMNGNDPNSNTNDNGVKKIRTSDQHEQESNDANFRLDLNLPFPDTNAKACIVKLYGSSELKLNDVIEVFGILSLDSPCTFENSEDGKITCPMEVDFEEVLAHNPSPLLVPRIHALFLRPLIHNNPLLPFVDKETEQFSSSLTNILHDAKEIQKELHAILTQALLGDMLAADYLICNLVSTVFGRHDVTTLGKFCLNLCNVPTKDDYISKLSSLLQNLTTKAHSLPLSLQNLNSLSFRPKKDYKANRLLSGVLQLPEHTHLILDETALSVGQLNQQGIENVKALCAMIDSQRIEYDFQYHQLEYLTDIATLVLSEGRSILPSDYRVPLKPSMTVESVGRNFASISEYLGEDLLNKIRCYLTILKHVDYVIPDDLNTVIQNDFVNMRKENSSVDGNSLHTLLVLSRYISLSGGEKSLSKDSWEKAKLMEVERKQRL